MVDFTQFPFTGQRPDSDDIPEGLVNLYFTAAERAVLALLDPAAQIPVGGAAGERLTKVDGTDYNVEWTPDPTIDVGLTAFNGRTVADVVPTLGDYNTSLVVHDPTGSTLSGTTTKAALDELAFRTDATPINGHIIQNSGVDVAQEDRLNFDSVYLTVTPQAGVSTNIGFDASGLMTVAQYDPQGIGGDAFALEDHTGSLTLSQISDAGALAAEDQISVSAQLADNVVIDSKLSSTGVVATTYQWPTFEVNVKGRILSASENVDPLARANHTGTQLMATISDAAAIATSGSADDLSNGSVNAAMLLTERTKLSQLDVNAQVPIGGTLGQVLTKNSAANFDTSWQAPGVGGSGHVIKDDVTTFPQRTNLTFLGFSVVDDSLGDSTNVVAPTGQPLAFYGAYGIQDVDLPESVTLSTGTWIEFVPTNAPTQDPNNDNVSAGANNGRLAVDFGLAIPETNATVVAAMTLDVTSSNTTVEVGIFENGSVIADTLITQAVSTAGNHTSGLGFPVTFYVPLSDGVFEGNEYSIGFRRQSGSGNINVTSFYLTLQGGEEAGTLGTGDMLKSIYDTNDDAIVDKADSICRNAVNRSGATIPRGALVTFVQWDVTADVPEIALADKDTPGAVAAGMTLTEVLDNNTGIVVVDGIVDQVNTLGTVALQVVYLGNAGAVTYTEPTAGLVQPIGFVLRENSASGSISVDEPLKATELAEVFLLARDARLAGDMSSEGFGIRFKDGPAGTDLGYIQHSVGGVQLEATSGPLALDGSTVAVGSPGSITLGGNSIVIDGTGASTDINVSNNQPVRLGPDLTVTTTAGTVVYAPGPTIGPELRLVRGDDVNAIDAKLVVREAGGAEAVSLGSFGASLARQLRFNGNGSVLNQGTGQTVSVNNVVFRNEAVTDVLRMPAVDGNAGEVLQTDGAGNLTLGAVPSAAPTEQTITYGSPNTAWDLATMPAGLLTLTGDTTLDASNVVNGRTYTLTVAQDGVGGHSVNLNTGFENSGNPLFLSVVANARTAYEFYATNGVLRFLRNTLSDDFILKDAADADRGVFRWDETNDDVVLEALSADIIVRSTGSGSFLIDAVNELDIRCRDELDIVSGLSGTGNMRLNPATDRSVELSTDFLVDPANAQIVYQPGAANFRNTNFIVRSKPGGGAFNATLNVELFDSSSGWTLQAMNTGVNNLKANGNGILQNAADSEYLDVNNYRFTLDSTGDTFIMPSDDPPGGGVFQTDGSGNVTIAPGTGPGDPRIGNFSSTSGTVTVNLANIEVAYVTCNEAAVTVTFSNGVNGKVYTVVFIDTAGSLVLTAGANTVFGTDITSYPLFGGAGELHWLAFGYYGPTSKYHLIAFARGYPSA